MNVNSRLKLLGLGICHPYKHIVTKPPSAATIGLGGQSNGLSAISEEYIPSLAKNSPRTASQATEKHLWAIVTAAGLKEFWRNHIS